MIKEYKPFTEETLDDALSVIRERFPPSAEEIARKVLRNPLRKLCSDAGTIGYRDGRPVCFQANMLRRFYFGTKPVLGVAGGLVCKALKGCPLSMLMEVIDRSSNPRAGAAFTFGNSCCSSTADMYDNGGANAGCPSCARELWRPVRIVGCLGYVFRRKILRRPVPTWSAFNTLTCPAFDVHDEDLSICRALDVRTDFFDTLMTDYLTTNEGVVASRTEDEVAWMFEDKIKDGRAVLLCATQGQKPVGYIVFGSDEAARRWMLMDWFARNNDFSVLSKLLKVACTFLRKNTPAIIFETRGFPSFAQPILKRYLPFIQQKGVNFFTWSFLPNREIEGFKAAAYTDKSWFFGPYDGDLVM